MTITALMGLTDVHIPFSSDVPLCLRFTLQHVLFSSDEYWSFSRNGCVKHWVSKLECFCFCFVSILVLFLVFFCFWFVCFVLHFVLFFALLLCFFYFVLCFALHLHFFVFCYSFCFILLFCFQVKPEITLNDFVWL